MNSWKNLMDKWNKFADWCNTPKGFHRLGALLSICLLGPLVIWAVIQEGVDIFYVILGLLLVVYEATNNFLKSLAASVGGEGVLAALVLAVIALVVAARSQDRVEELTKRVEKLEEMLEAAQEEEEQNERETRRRRIREQYGNDLDDEAVEMIDHFEREWSDSPESRDLAILHECILNSRRRREKQEGPKGK